MSIFDDFIKETGVPCEIVKKYSAQIAITSWTPSTSITSDN